MAFDENIVACSFDFDPAEVAELRRRWLALLDMAVWGDLKAAKIGALPRLRKRFLELGELLRSVVADRSWIPRPREQVKGALGASMNLRDGLLNLERAARLLEGGEDFPGFERELLDFRERLVRFVERHEAAWAEQLEAQYDESIDDPDEDEGNEDDRG